MNGGFQSKKAQENAKEKNLQGKDSPAKQDTRTKQPKQLHRTKLCSSIPPGRRTHSPRRHQPSQQHQLIQTGQVTNKIKQHKIIYNFLFKLIS